jgi:molecular chaperone HtpG
MVSDTAVAGLRLRKRNIAVGGAERMSEVFEEVAESNKRFNSWLIGEVHVASDGVIPNARRDGFEAGDDWLGIKAQLVEFAKIRSKEIRDYSDVRNISVEKLARPAERAADEIVARAVVGVASKEEKATLSGDLDKHEEKLEKALKGDRTDADRARLETAKGRIAEAKGKLETAPFVGSRLKTSLDRKQRKLLAEVLETLRGVLENEDYLRAEGAILEKFGSTGKNGDEQHPPR